MRHHRSLSIFVRALLLAGVAVGAAQADVLVTLGASSGNSAGCSLSGAGVCTLTARVTGLPSAVVTFSFNPVVTGAVVGNPSVPDSTGLTRVTYTAPNVVTQRQTITVTATATDGSSASTEITLVPPSATVRVSPATVTMTAGQTQSFSATVLGVSNTGVTWSISPALGSIDPVSGFYTAPTPITGTQTVTVTATSNFDGTSTGTAKITLQAATVVTITISPTTVTLGNGGTQDFNATVTNATNTAVTWSINPQSGTIDQNGLYTAPAAIATGAPKVIVTATSVADPTKSANATVTLTPTIGVGSGAPNSTIQLAFIQAFGRNNFASQVVLPPVANVATFGASGFVQTFTDATNSTLRDALVTGSTTVGGPNAIFQIMGVLWTYYNSFGSGTAGYPLSDSQGCSALGTPCVWDTFDKNYALFAYASNLVSGQNFNINGVFYTEWNTLGGISYVGPPVTAPTTITAAIVAPATVGTTASVQTFAQGAIYSITSGANRGKIFGITEPVYDLYLAQGGTTGSLGLPTSELLQVSNGVYKQTFEGGTLQYIPGGGDPTVLLPVAVVRLPGAPAGTVNLNLGQNLTVTAQPMASDGTVLTRPVSWVTSNSKVLTVVATGATAVVTAVGAGTATVQAASQGVLSAKVSFQVTAPCCAVGDGAPVTVQQAFLDALTRNKIVPQVPVASPASRVGNGYLQMVQSADPTIAGSYMVAVSDSVGTAYVVSGALLTKYQAMGGPGGVLGYPTGDASAGGTQLFANHMALSGNPVRVISGVILSKWTLMGSESGPAGVPLSDAVEFTTPGANSGMAQTFAKGVIFGATDGPRTGQAYFVSGLILARYTALGGASGDFGMPTSDEFATGAVHQQNFEGGNLTYATGDGAAVEHPTPKVPSVQVAPASVAAGGRARLAVTGFANNSTLRVSLTGQPDFLVTTANGAYSWDMSVPLSAKSGTITIHAVDTRSTATADGTLTIKGFTDNRLPIAKVQGDNQVGLPGALLPVSIRVAIADASGTPVAGAAVTFDASTAVRLSTRSAVTDISGLAETWVRLPASEGISAVTVNAPSVAQVPVTFFVRSAASTLSNFPKLAQSGDAILGNGTASIAQKGALLTAVSSILRYHQNRGELRTPNGLADAAGLNQFLKAFCVVDPKGAQLCDGFLTGGSGEQVVNLWRAAEFAGGVDVQVLDQTAVSVADVLAQGTPALLSLALSQNGVAAGGHFVTAIGVNSDGSIVIQDPNPFFGRTSLNDYLNGFAAGGGVWKAELRGLVQFALRAPSATRFMVGAISQPAGVALSIQSIAGSCGVPLDLLDAVDAAGNAVKPLVSRLEVCDGSQANYQIAVTSAGPFQAFVTDLASAGGTTDISGGSSAAYKAGRTQLNLTVAPQDANISAGAVVSAATFTPGIAPGGIMAIFGSGLAGPGTATTVDMDGTPSTVFGASAFQVNALVPATMTPGSHTLRVKSAFGVAQQTVTVSALAPQIFLVATPPTGAVLNLDYSLNTATNPIARGQALTIFATGLGAVVKQGTNSITTTPVTVVLNGQELPTIFAGLAPGYTGLYQVNVVIPATTAPSLAVPLALKEGGQLSNVVYVALQ